MIWLPRHSARRSMKLSRGQPAIHSTIGKLNSDCTVYVYSRQTVKIQPITVVLQSHSVCKEDKQWIKAVIGIGRNIKSLLHAVTNTTLHLLQLMVKVNFVSIKIGWKLFSESANREKEKEIFMVLFLCSSFSTSNFSLWHFLSPLFF